MKISEEVKKYWDFEYTITQNHPIEIFTKPSFETYPEYCGVIVDDRPVADSKAIIYSIYYNYYGVIHNPNENEPSMMKRLYSTIINDSNKTKLFFVYYWCNIKGTRHRLYGPAYIQKTFLFEDGKFIEETLENIWFFNGFKVDTVEVENWLKESKISLDNMSEPDKVLMRMKFDF